MSLELEYIIYIRGRISIHKEIETVITEIYGNRNKDLWNIAGDELLG